MDTRQTDKIPSGIRFSKEGRDITDAIRANKGVSRMTVMEMTIKGMYEKECVGMPDMVLNI